MKRKVFFSSRALSEVGPASRNTILSLIKFTREIGFEIHVMKRSRQDGGVFNYYAGLLSSFGNADVFLAAYPYFCGPTLENPLRTVDRHILRILRKIRSRRGAVLYVVDSPIEQAAASGRERLIDGEAYRTERSVFENFDVLCVFNDFMRQSISGRYGIPADKFVEFEVLDHAAGYVPSRAAKPSGKRTIAFVGNPERDWDPRGRKWVSELPQAETVRYTFRGRNWNWVSKLGRPDIVNEGFLPEVPFLKRLSEDAHFGLIYAPSKEWAQYLNKGSTSKFGAYSAAGLPIIVSSKCQYISSLVSKYGVGLVFDELGDIPSLVEQTSQSDYEKMRICSLDLGEKVRGGYFFKRAMSLALSKLGIR